LHRPHVSFRQGVRLDGPHLDFAVAGPRYLQRREIAQIVVDGLYRAVELGHCELCAWVVMANHVHVLIEPLIEPGRLIKLVKRATAREANRVLGLTESYFWQKETYDHWVRDAAEFDRTRRYIENNPVKAGLAVRPEDYRWSSGYVEAGR
jgi:REP element-mobilizing transposase RayT